LKGEVLDEKSRPIPGALCTLTASRTGLLPQQGISLTTGNDGQFAFPGLLPGTYTIYCSALGREPVVKTGIELTQGQQPPFIEISLPPEVIVRQHIEVRERANVVSAQTAAPPATINAAQLRTLPLAEQRFKAALPLVPGVVRTPDGKINIKGVTESHGLLLVDLAETVDPVTGAFSIDVPIDAIESVDVFKSAYRAEFGRFSGGLTTVQTKPPSDRWDFELNDLLPTFRIKAGHIVGIADDGPRMLLTGPLIKNRLNFLEALTYEMVKQPVRGLAWPDNETKTESVNSFTSFQYIFSAKQILAVNTKVFPLKREFANINSLVPQSASSNYGQSGYSIGATDRYLFSSGGVLTALIQATRFDSNAYGQGAENMLITPDGWGGNFFNSYNRSSTEEELLGTYQFQNREWHGRHEFKFGGNFAHRAYTGRTTSHPVQLLRQDGTVAEQVDFLGPGRLDVGDIEAALFAQDHWALNDQIALDYGLRFSGQAIGEAAALGPRLGVVYSPGEGGKTIFRSGIGEFYDRLPLLAGDFTDNPTRSVTLFDEQGLPLGPPTVYRNVYVRVNENGDHIIPNGQYLGSTPYNLTWTVEGDRELRPHVLARVSYLYSRTHNEFIFNPENLPGVSRILLLTNTGNSRYYELESTLRFQPSESSDVNVSYVHSQGRGDLNTLNQLYVPFEQPVIRPNFFGNLNSDIPNRVVAWGRFPLPWRVTASPVLDVHTGFPYSVVDVFQNYVGAPNTQRFPYLLSIDLKLSKDFTLPFIPWVKRHKFRGAIAVYNITNHANPRDIYSNISSPNFGHFVGFQHRLYETWFDIVY
jgi:hypothetical protein